MLLFASLCGEFVFNRLVFLIFSEFIYEIDFVNLLENAIPVIFLQVDWIIHTSGLEL